jgi:hypothetical protein
METSILGEPSKFQFSFVMGQSKWLIATKKENKIGKHHGPSHELEHEYTIHMNATYFTSLWMKPRMKPQILPHDMRPNM